LIDGKSVEYFMAFFPYPAGVYRPAALMSFKHSPDAGTRPSADWALNMP
jgi:hypothetical protein